MAAGPGVYPLPNSRGGGLVVYNVRIAGFSLVNGTSEACAAGHRFPSAFPLAKYSRKQRDRRPSRAPAVSAVQSLLTSAGDLST
jgi:hypothetical protein